MRTNSFFKNGLWGIISFGINFILGLYLRKLFLLTFNPDILGYQGTIGDIFSLLNISELGAGAVITYHMYGAIANKSTEEVSLLMSIYKKTYRIIGLFILCSGIIAAFFLRLIFSEPGINWEEVYTIYLICMSETVLNYFVVFRRVLFIADQKEYICAKVDVICSFVSSIIRVLIIKYFPNYALYMFVWLFTTVFASIALIPFYHKYYPSVTNKKVTFEEYRKIGFFKDIKWYSVQQLAFAIYGSIDSLLTARFLGVAIATLTSNYINIVGSVTVFLDKLLSGLKASIGNITYADNERTKIWLFRRLDAISFGLASVVMCCYLFLFQPVIILWLGERYLLPNSYVFFLALNKYISYNHSIIGYFRASVGKFEIDTRNAIVSAVINLVSSILLMRILGITGLMIGTCLAHIPLWWGRTKVVFTNIISFEENRHYWLQQLYRLLIIFLDILLIYIFTKDFKDGFLWIVLRGFVCLLVTITVFLFFYRHTGVIDFIKDKILMIKKGLACKINNNNKK